MPECVSLPISRPGTCGTGQICLWNTAVVRPSLRGACRTSTPPPPPPPTAGPRTKKGAGRRRERAQPPPRGPPRRALPPQRRCGVPPPRQQAERLRTRPGRVRFFKSHRVGRVRDASGTRPRPFLTEGSSPHYAFPFPLYAAHACGGEDNSRARAGLYAGVHGSCCQQGTGQARIIFGPGRICFKTVKKAWLAPWPWHARNNSWLAPRPRHARKESWLARWGNAREKKLLACLSCAAGLDLGDESLMFSLCLRAWARKKTWLASWLGWPAKTNPGLLSAGVAHEKKGLACFLAGWPAKTILACFLACVVQRSARSALCRAEQCSAVQCSAVQCSAVQCSAVQCTGQPARYT
eukprot:gene22149-biopygen14744